VRGMQISWSNNPSQVKGGEKGGEVRGAMTSNPGARHADSERQVGGKQLHTVPRPAIVGKLLALQAELLPQVISSSDGEALVENNHGLR
jgi:hypothetical protein